METKKIQIIYKGLKENNDEKIMLSYSNPDFSELTKFIVKNNGEIDKNRIEIEVENDKFDKKALKEIIFDVAQKYKNKLDEHNELMKEYEEAINKSHEVE